MWGEAQAARIHHQGERGHRVVGKHVYGSAMNCNVSKLSDSEFLTDLVKEAARIGKMTLLDVRAWKIHPGVTVIGVVLESHISIHTWPEYAFATVDVYSCGEYSRPELAFEYIVEQLEAKEIVRGYIDRSLV